jgi:hypothetical protein
MGMMTITRGLAVGIVLAAAALGLASPASAEPLSGNYTATVTASSGALLTRIGETIPLIFTPCGPDCTHMADPGEPTVDKDLQRQGDTWTKTNEGVGCTTTVNGNLVLTVDCGNSTTVYQLTKNG